MSRRIAHLLPALGLAGLLGLLSTLLAPSAALAAEEPRGEFCPDESGVSVVVDFGDLGEGVERACVDGGGQVATEVIEAAGFDLTPVGPFPGATCQIDGEPADASCGAMPAGDAYWGLYVAQPGGEWDFAPVGADELTLEDGAFVGFAWQGSAEPAPPSAEPVAGEPGSGAEEPTAETSEESTDDGVASGLPVWAIYVVLAVLLVTVIVVALLRRRRT